MTWFHRSLTARIFVAIAAAAVLIIAVMALLIAASMRDGFGRYLLQGELARFDGLVRALVLAHDPDVPGWPDLVASPGAWSDIVRANVPPTGIAPPPPPDASAGRIGGTPPDEGPSVAPSSTVPMAGPPFGERPARGGPPPTGRLALLGATGTRLAGSPDRSGLTERRPICADADCARGVLGYLSLSAPVIPEEAGARVFLREQYVAVGLSALIAILVSALAAYLVARRILVPIRQLAAGARTMASGNYTARIAQRRTDELGQLVGHYNVLAATLERTDRAEREWISNTSHELQTPLAVLRAHVEALQDGVRPPDAATLDAMHAATLRLSRLVQDIGTLSYAREGRLVPSLRGEDLRAIAAECAEAARPALAAKGIVLGLDLPAEAIVPPCDRTRIGQVVDNLLQNAARYTESPGRVCLQLRDADGSAHLVVEDTPPGPPEADLPRLFDRFYRVESSRSRAHGGAGLGLSVCRAIVEAHGGTIVAGPSDLGGLRIDVRLPKAAA